MDNTTTHKGPYPEGDRVPEQMSPVKDESIIILITSTTKRKEHHLPT